MSKNPQSWGQPKRDPIKDLEKYKEYTLKQALVPREPWSLIISPKMYEFLQTNDPDFLKYCKVITVTEPEPNQQ